MMRKNLILLVDREMDVVMDIADGITVLEFGIQIDEGSPDEIRSKEFVRGRIRPGIE